MAKFKKVVFVPCRTGEDGKCITKNMIPPYGNHHFMGVYEDGSFWMIGAINADVSGENAIKIAKLLTKESLPVETDPDFYLNRL